MSEEPDEVIVICARITTPLYISDNKIGRCSECGWKVQFRPHAPGGPKICMECFADQAPQEYEIEPTSQQRMIEDAVRYFRKKRQ